MLTGGLDQRPVCERIYDALERNVESDLVEISRASSNSDLFCGDGSDVYGTFGIRFHGLQSSGLPWQFIGSFLVGRGLLAGTSVASPTPGSRWDMKSSVVAAGLRAKYQNREITFSVMRESSALAGATYLICVCMQAKRNTSGGEAAFRWLQHHGMLAPQCNDAIIVGASSLSQLEQNFIGG